MNITSKKYIAIIADIRNSKKISNRNEFQKEFIRVVNGINEKFSKNITSKFTVTLGDECQGLFCGIKNILDVITYMRLELDTVDFRYGIGIGNLSTEYEKELSIGADGTVFYAAREAIDMVKKIELYNKVSKTDIVIINYENNKLTYELNLILKNMTYIYNRMNKNQKYLVNTMLFNKNKTIKELSSDMEVSYQALNRSLISAGYYWYKENYDYVNRKVEDIYNDN